MKTAATILTKRAFEQGYRLKSEWNAFPVQSDESVAAVILPYHRQIPAGLRQENTSEIAFRDR